SRSGAAAAVEDEPSEPGATAVVLSAGPVPLDVSCAAAGQANARKAMNIVAVVSVRFIVVSSSLFIEKSVVVSGFSRTRVYVNGIVSTVSKVTVTFGSVLSTPSIAFGGAMP